MTRIRRGYIARRRRTKIRLFASSFWGARSRLTRTIIQQKIRSFVSSHRDRDRKKRDFRHLWITRIKRLKRLKAICHGQAYQKRVAKSFNRKVRPRHFEIEDLVVKKVIPNNSDPRGKFTPIYEGPYVVKKVLPGGALILVNMDGVELAHPVNADAVKTFYP